jgi:hypothetical protein
MKQTVLALVLALIAEPAVADRGAVVTEGVDLREPAQRAIVAHNGTWELLVLQTDILADKATQVVEFMPLPSKPEVSLAPDGCFQNLQALVEKHQLRYIVSWSGRGKVSDQSGKGEGISFRIGPSGEW